MKATELPARFTAEKHLAPLWSAETIYDDTILFVGEEGAGTLAFLPAGKIIVRSYTLDTVYEEGKGLCRRRQDRPPVEGLFPAVYRGRKILSPGAGQRRHRCG